MTKKRMTVWMLGGLLALHFVGGVLPGAGATAEAASYHQSAPMQANDDFNRAIRKEHDRHERKVHEIRTKYRAHSQMNRLERELWKERELHEKNMREIHRRYHHQSATHTKHHS